MVAIAATTVHFYGLRWLNTWLFKCSLFSSYVFIGCICNELQEKKGNTYAVAKTEEGSCLHPSYKHVIQKLIRCYLSVLPADV